nr:hypothetical protein [Patescibacteria group bacterium]
MGKTRSPKRSKYRTAKTKRGYHLHEGECLAVFQPHKSQKTSQGK